MFIHANTVVRLQLVRFLETVQTGYSHFFNWSVVVQCMFHCHSRILQWATFFPITRALTTAWMKFDAFIYTSYPRWKNYIKYERVLLSSNDTRRLFEPESGFLNKKFKVFVTFIICSVLKSTARFSVNPPWSECTA